MVCIRRLLCAAVVLLLSAVNSLCQTGESPSTLYEEGERLLQRGETQQAFLHFDKAIEQARREETWDLYVKGLNRIASLKLDDDDHLKTFRRLKQSTDVLEKLKADKEIAEAHYNIAQFYYDLTYEIDTPVYHYQKARKIWTSLAGEADRRVADCYQGLGSIYKYRKNDFLEAEKSYEKALNIREKIKLDNPRVMARNYYSLATTNRSQRDFEKALSYGIKTLELVKTLDDNVYLEMTYATIANIHRDMNNASLAKEYYQRAIAVNRKTGDRETLAWYYQGLGETLKNESLYDEATQNFLKAFQIYNTIEVNDKLLYVYLLEQMADTYDLNNKDAQCIETFDRLFKALESLDISTGRQVAQAHTGLGDYYQRRRKYKEALLHYQKALMAAVKQFHSTRPQDNPSESMIGVNYYVYSILARKASAWKALYTSSGDQQELTYALQCLFTAEKLLSEERNTLDLEDSKWKFLDANYNLYEEIVETLHEMIRLQPRDSLLEYVFKYVELSKARSLTDALLQAERVGGISDDDSLLRVHHDLKRQLFNAQDKLSAEETSGNPSNMVKLRESIVALDRKIQQSKTALEEKYPGYFKIKYGNATPTLATVKRMAADQDQIILEYFWGNRSVYAIGIGKDQVKFEKLGSADSLAITVNNLLKHFQDDHSSAKPEAFKTFSENAHALFQQLVEPFNARMMDIRKVKIIPDGPASQIPFEVLLTEKPGSASVDYLNLPYMLKAHTIGYAYSSSMLLRDPKEAVRIPAVLAMGFTGGQRLRSNDIPLREMKGTELELEAMSRRFGSGKFLAGSEATESNFKTLAPASDIIHLAIHGRGDAGKNFAASLYFNGKNDSLEDGELHTYELYGLKLKALLTVLSACESGIGKDYKGEGMISMASGFVYAGCDNILMSLWKVNDQASTTLMDVFYSHLLAGEDIDLALTTAKLDYLNNADELTADPKVWAPLVGYGKLDHVFEKRNSRITSMLLVSFIALSILLLVYYFWRKRSSARTTGADPYPR